MGWREDKQARKEYYLKWVYGWKQRECTACNGSGVYDHNGSPPCGACEGTGKETYKPEPKKENVKTVGLCSSYACVNGKNICCRDCEQLQECKDKKIYCQWISENDCPDYNANESEDGKYENVPED